MPGSRPTTSATSSTATSSSDPRYHEPTSTTTMKRQGSSSRLPFRPRDVNLAVRSSSTASMASSKGSGGSRGSSSIASKYLHSYLESSNNPNNQRITTSTSNLSSSTLRKFNSSGGEAEAGEGEGGREGSAVVFPSAVAATSCAAEQTDSSTVVNTGAGLRIPLLSAEAEEAKSDEDRLAADTAVCGTARTKSTTTSSGLAAPGPSLRKSSSSSRQKPQVTPEDHEEIEIIEHRKKVNGDGFTVHKYIRGRLLGKGGFAKVYWCTSLDTNRHYAVKIVPKANLVKSRARQKLQAEIKIHRSLKHKHVCEYKHFFEDKVNCYILLELCQNQSMNEMIKRRKRLTEPEVKYYMKQLLDAVRYMHKINVIHRDLKLGNLFLDKNLTVKVGDFGLATRLSSSEEKRKTICGTPNYIAPEVIDGNKEKRGHSFEVDIWSMGVICFTMLIGKPPYESKDVKSTYQRILANQYEFPSHIPISGHARELISAMLQTNPQQRPTLDEIAAHPFFTHDKAKIPKTVPLSGTHIAPDWQEDSNGDIFATEKESDEKYRRPTISSRRRKTVDSSEQKTSSNRHHALLSGNGNSRAENKGCTTNTKAGSALSKTPCGQSSHFRIFNDETEAELKPTALGTFSHHKKAPQACPADPIDGLVREVETCSIGDGERKSKFNSTQALSEAESKSGSISSRKISSSDKDVQALEAMHNRLRDAFEAAELGSNATKAGKFQQPSYNMNRDIGSNRWVTRYVDYTSKYGLGFLLNDGSAGVYFNDSTKSILAPEGETFMYVERRRVGTANENACEMHTLSSYPECLQKKVTLLKHFRNYLVEQQKKAEEDGDGDAGTTTAVEVVDLQPDTSLVYLKKWVRTKHAILFRLSNGTVQVVFYDHTEILLSDEAKIVTYVDKKRQRTSCHLDNIMMDSSAEIGKRLKYAKDILKQLIPGMKS